MRPTLVLATVLVALAGCGSRGNGDLDHLAPNPKPFGTPIAQQTDPAHRLPNGAPFVADGVVVVAVDSYDETQDGKSIGNVYVQDPVQPTPWSGLTLFRPTPNPPDLALTPGQGVDVAGPFDAFTGPSTSPPFPSGIILPEVKSGSISMSYEGEAPAPVDVTIDDFTDTNKAMQYVGRLVRMQNIQVGAFQGSRQQAYINGPSGPSNVQLAGQLMPLAPYAGGPLKGGQTLKSVVGVLNYFYTPFQLCPRTSADIEQ